MTPLANVTWTYTYTHTYTITIYYNTVRSCKIACRYIAQIIWIGIVITLHMHCCPYTAFYTVLSSIYTGLCCITLSVKNLLHTLAIESKSAIIALAMSERQRHAWGAGRSLSIITSSLLKLWVHADCWASQTSLARGAISAFQAQLGVFYDVIPWHNNVTHKN